MFKIPEWEADVPKSDINFVRKFNKQKFKKSTENLDKPLGSKTNGNTETKDKPIRNPFIVKTSKKRKRKKRNKTAEDTSDKTTDLNTYKPGRFVINPLINNDKNETTVNKNLRTKKKRKLENTEENTHNKQTDEDCGPSPKTHKKKNKNSTLTQSDHSSIVVKADKSENQTNNDGVTLKKGKRKRNKNKKIPESNTSIDSNKLDDNKETVNFNTQTVKDGVTLSKKLKGKKNKNKINETSGPGNKTDLDRTDENKQTNNINNKTDKDVTQYKKRKRKHKKNNEISQSEDLNLHDIDVDKPDEELLNAKKRKLDSAFENDDREDLLFSEGKSEKVNLKKHTTEDDDNASQKTNSENAILNKHTKFNHKKEKLRKLLQMKESKESNRNPINVNGNKLRERMMEKLKAAQFRYLNEKLYTSSGTEAQQLFQTDPIAFQTYHQGYQQQLKKWPVNPLDIIVKKIMKMPKSNIIADMGCGEAALARRVPHTVRSFDLVAAAPGVEACDMARTPLLAASVHVAVYCLALMGTDLTKYLVEANRVLKDGGQLLIAEVESRFEDVNTFIQDVQRLGFKLTKLDKDHDVFFFMEFKKICDTPKKQSKLPTLTLKPCLYKRR